jgi:DeoR family transcriptional regulator of aga operon
LDELALNVAILGVDALDPELGAMAFNEGEASINRLLAERALKVVVVADSSKLTRRALARICRVDQIHVLVTDTDAPADVVARLAEAGVEVRCV